MNNTNTTILILYEYNRSKGSRKAVQVNERLVWYTYEWLFIMKEGAKGVAMNSYTTEDSNISELECGTWYHHPRRLQCVWSRNLSQPLLNMNIESNFDATLWRHRWRHHHKNLFWHNLGRSFHIWGQIEAVFNISNFLKWPPFWARQTFYHKLYRKLNIPER